MADTQTVDPGYVNDVVSSNFPGADPDYVNATIGAESSYNPNAISHDKNGNPIAYGLTQDTPKTGLAEFKKLQQSGKISSDEEYNSLDPEQNIKVGTSYLSSTLGTDKDFNGDKRLISAAYNDGPGNVKALMKQYGNSYEDIAAYLPSETQKYVARVATNYNKLKAQSSNETDSNIDPSTFGNREDGTPKGTGFLGVLKRPDGGISTELSVGVEIDGKEVEVPTLIPGLSKSEINTLLTNDKGIDGIPRTIIDKATAFAKQRIAAGKSPFASNDESPTPAKNTQPAEQDKNAQLISTIKSSPPNADGFTKSAALVTDDPDFATLPFIDQAKKITQIYNAKNWSKSGTEEYKNTMAKLWNSADPDETPDISQMVGAPPVVQPGQNPATVLGAWQKASTQKLIKQGLTPGFFGGKLEDYYNNASQAETDAFGVRNEGWIASGADLAANTVRGGAKGLVRIATDPLAQVARIFSLPGSAYTSDPSQLSPEDKTQVETAQKRAEFIMKIPDILGTPSNASAYATDPNTGKLRINPDGTPQLKAQQSAGQIADSVGGAIAQGVGLLGGGLALKAAGASATAASLAVASDQALTFANSSYNTVYRDTGGDSRKAMAASLLAMPLGFVGELGALKTVSQEISPVIAEMTAADKALYVANSIVKKGAINTAIGVGMDATQQAAEISQTGKDYNVGRTIETGAISGVAGALIGSVHDWVAGQVGSFAQNKMKSIGDAALADFRNSTDGVRTINVSAVSKDLVDTFGMDVESNNNGTVTVTKKGYVVPEGATLDDLTKQLAATYSSDDIKEIGQKQAALSAKQNRTPEEDAQLTQYNQVLGAVQPGEYQNSVKGLERAIEEHPDRFNLGVSRDQSTNIWTHLDTDTQSLALKDVLVRKEPEYTNDLSDTSKLKVLDEDEIKNRTFNQEPINPKATEEHINVSNKLDKVNNDIRDLQNERDSLPPAPLEGDDPNAERRAEIKDELNQKTIDKRNLQSDVVRTKGPRDTEQGALEVQNKAQKDFEKQKANDLKTVANLTKKGRVGEYNTEDHSITLTSAATPEAKAENTAHELAHGIAKDLNLSKEANNAIDDHVKTLEASIPAINVKDLAKKVFLPNSLERVTKNVPEDAQASKLNTKSKTAIIGRDEVLANQVGAVMLKRAGYDIGDFKILPEVEASLRKTKLPDVREVLNPTRTETPKENVNVKEEAKAATSVAERPTEKVVSAQTDQTSNPLETGQNVTEPPDSTPRFDTETGKVGQTRFSKKVTAANPDIAPVNYNEKSKALGEVGAKAHIEQHGLDETQKYLSTPESFKMEPSDRSALVEELYAQRKAEFNANPTPENNYQRSLARQLRAKAGIASAQGLAFLNKFRSSDTFADLLGNIDEAYRNAGMKPPDYTQAMIDELRGNFEKADKLPKGSRARNTEVDNVFTKTLGFNKTNWGTFLAKYSRTNLLSGTGTQLVVANSSLFMGPIMTALAHPIEGGGLMWRAMWQAKGVAASGWRATIAGEGGKALWNGIYDPSPVSMGEKPTVESGFAALYSKYGNKFLNALAAAHGYSKTLSAEGFLAHKGYLELKAQYGNDPAKFSAEVSKLILNPKDIEIAKQQAQNEYDNAGIKAKPGAIGVRAYEILRTQSHTPEQLEIAEDYARGVSHAGDMGNVTHQMALEVFNSRILNSPLLAPVKFVVQPFGRAMLALSDYAVDYIPGNFAIDPVLRKLGNTLDRARGGEGDYYKPRSEALQTRLRNGQAIGAVMSATLLGLSRSGMFKITGDEQKSDIEGEGKDFEGGAATNRTDFAEAKQKGEPAYSIIFPNGFALDYKDLPGLNALSYGIWKVNQAIDSGKGIGTGAVEFYKGAFGYAMPFFGGGTLNSPLYTLGQAILNPEADSKSVQDAAQKTAERWNKFYEQSADTAEKMLVPFSSFLRDVQQVYDQPEESHQPLLQRVFRNVPGVSSLVGSQNAVDRFGDPVQRTGEEHVPGLSRIAGQVTPESGDVWDKLNAKGLIVKEMGNYINFHKADLGSADRFSAYQKTREERIGSAYAKTLTPDEWNQFRQATGPYIKAAANSIADSDLPHDTAQETLTKRITAIEEQSLKRYVATGKF